MLNFKYLADEMREEAEAVGKGKASDATVLEYHSSENTVG